MWTAAARTSSAYIEGDLVTVTGNTFQDNATEDEYYYGGGGAYIEGDTSVTVTNNTFRGNLAGGSGDGGGAYIDSSNAITLTGNTFTENNGYYGGGAEIYGDSITITNNCFTGNSAIEGGGAEIGGYDELFLNNNVFAGNTATSYYGGGLDTDTGIYPALATIRNNTFTQNSAPEGGGMYLMARNNSAILNVYDNIVWGNTATTGADLYIRDDGESDGTGANVNFKCNDYSGLYVDDGDHFTQSDNIDADPLFMDLGYWAGPDWIEGDYHVYPSSPTIDAGDPHSSYSNEPEPNGDRVNMGAYGNTSEAATRSFDTLRSTSIADINSNSVPEFSLLSVNWAANRAVVQSKDLSTGLLVKNVWCSGPFKPLALDMVPDLNSNGSSELAMVSVHPDSGMVVGQVKDSSTGLLLNNTWFGSVFAPVALMTVPDLNTNGSSEVAMLGANWSTGKVVMQVRDPLTGLSVVNIWFSDAYAPLAMDVVPDINSNGAPELAVLSTDWGTGKVVVQVKDSSTGLLVNNVWFSDAYEPMALEVVDDQNANGFSELVVLSMDRSTGKVVVQVKDSSTGLLVNNVWFSDLYTPLALKTVPDQNANGSPELAVLSVDYSTCKVLVQVKDSSTGLLVKNVRFSDTYAPVSLQVLSDLNANGSSELAVLSVNSRTGAVVSQVKDPVTGSVVKNLWF